MHGKISLNDGTYYEGSVVNMKKEGKGFYQHENIKYNGYFKDNLFEGTG